MRRDDVGGDCDRLRLLGTTGGDRCRARGKERRRPCETADGEHAEDGEVLHGVLLLSKVRERPPPRNWTPRRYRCQF
jgi:hypothetical protein